MAESWHPSGWAFPHGRCFTFDFTSQLATQLNSGHWLKLVTWRSVRRGNVVLCKHVSRVMGLHAAPAKKKRRKKKAKGRLHKPGDPADAAIGDEKTAAACVWSSFCNSIGKDMTELERGAPVPGEYAVHKRLSGLLLTLAPVQQPLPSLPRLASNVRRRTSQHSYVNASQRTGCPSCGQSMRSACLAAPRLWWCAPQRAVAWSFSSMDRRWC